jgi:glycosyltransferase involved in cell wall biosynthesis
MSYAFCLPNKIFEYMMAGLPCIVSNLKDMSDYLNKYQVGIIAEEMTSEALKKSIYDITFLDRNLLLDKIRTAQKAINWNVEEEKMVMVYSELLSLPYE